MKLLSRTRSLQSVTGTLLSAVLLGGCPSAPLEVTQDAAVHANQDAGAKPSGDAQIADREQKLDLGNLAVCANDEANPMTPSRFLFAPIEETRPRPTDGGVVPPDQDAGQPANQLANQLANHDAGQPADEPFSGCKRVENTADLSHCHGLATVDTHTSELRLSLADSSLFVWTGDELAPDAISGLKTVHLDYIEARLPACGFCGSYDTRTLTITEAGEDGKLLHYEEHSEAEPRQVLTELFDTPVQARVLCQEAASEPRGCYFDITTLQAEYQLQTTPVQALPFGQATVLQTPQGNFKTHVAHSYQIGTHDDLCADGERLRASTAIVLSRQ